MPVSVIVMRDCNAHVFLHPYALDKQKVETYVDLTMADVQIKDQTKKNQIYKKVLWKKTGKGGNNKKKKMVQVRIIIPPTGCGRKCSCCGAVGGCNRFLIMLCNFVVQELRWI